MLVVQLTNDCEIGSFSSRMAMPNGRRLHAGWHGRMTQPPSERESTHTRTRLLRDERELYDPSDSLHLPMHSHFSSPFGVIGDAMQRWESTHTHTRLLRDARHLSSQSNSLQSPMHSHFSSRLGYVGLRRGGWHGIYAAALWYERAGREVFIKKLYTLPYDNRKSYTNNKHPSNVSKGPMPG
jgi:hypothetical protein